MKHISIGSVVARCAQSAVAALGVKRPIEKCRRLS